MVTHRNVLELLVIAVLLLALAVMTAAMLISTAHGATTITACRTAPDRADRQWWSWRYVAGKRCWYRGRPGRDKATLRWEGGGELKAPRQAEVAPPLPEPPTVAPRLAAAHAVDPPMVPLPVVPVPVQMAAYNIVRLAPASLPLPPLPYPRPAVHEARSPLWLLTLPASAIVLRLLVLWFGIFVRKGVPA